MLVAIAGAAILAAAVFSARPIEAQDDNPRVVDMTAKYHFLSADDTLAILDEEGRLKGYIEVAQPQEESDDLLNYDILEGSRKKSHVEFRTNKIHGKYYRFSGTVERGPGHGEKDPGFSPPDRRRGYRHRQRGDWQGNCANRSGYSQVVWEIRETR